MPAVDVLVWAFGRELVRGGVRNEGSVWWGFVAEVFGWGGDSFEVKVGFRWGSMLGSLLFL